MVLMSKDATQKDEPLRNLIDTQLGNHTDMNIGTRPNNSILSNTRSSQKQMPTHSNYLQGKNLEDMVIMSPT